VASETTYVFFVFFSKSKKHDLLRVFELLHAFSRTLVERAPVEEFSDQFASESIFVTLSQTVATYLPIIGGT